MTAAHSLLEFDDSYARAVPGLSMPWTAAPVPAPELLALNEELAAELGIDPAELRTPAGVSLLVGHGLPDGVTPVAQVYAGHQFGNYVPRLGDGRALLLGEVIDTAGRRRDLHLKGSGRTPFARGGDGKAVIAPMLREYVIGEAMHGLGIPTTRGLAVVATGEPVRREATALPGAVLCRVAASHLRVGTFQYAAATGDRDVLRALADHAIARHHPDAADADQPYLELYRRVVDAQAELVARWMLVGFVHGVMNTDNMTISGETIDYGPCAFMDAVDPATVFSSIDHRGRYAFGNQPAVAQWNLARLAEALLPLIDPDADAAVVAATEVLGGFAGTYQRCWDQGMAAKLGLPAPDRALSTDVLELLHAQHIDFTLFFRALAAGTARSLFADPEPFDTWAERRAGAAARRRGRGAGGHGPGQPRLHPAQPPRRGGAHRGHRGRPRPVPPVGGSGHPAVRGAARAGRATPPRRRPAASRTSPTAVPDPRSRHPGTLGMAGSRYGRSAVRSVCAVRSGGHDHDPRRTAMSRALVISLASVAGVLLVAGILFGTYRAGWLPGLSPTSQGSTFQQSRIDELRADQSAASTASTDMAKASPAGKEVLRQQGHDVVAQACTISGEIHQLPSDLTDFVHRNCAEGEVAPNSEFATAADGGTVSDPDPGAS